MPDYQQGDTARLTLVVKDASGALADPSTLTLRTVTPARVTTTYTYPSAPIVRDSLGTFHGDVPLPAAGIWAYEWTTTNPGQVQGDTLTVTVDPTARSAAQQIARSRLANMVAADLEPTLSDAQLDDLLTLSSIPDINGVAATDTGWVETYDLNYAAAEGWRWKAAKAAASYAFTLDGDSPERSFLMIRCEHMADRYSKLIVTSVPVDTGLHLPSYIPLT